MSSDPEHPTVVDDQPPSSSGAYGTIGRYRVVTRIGEGGMGVVHRAVDDASQRTVAIKSLRRSDPEGLHRLKAEFRSVAQIAHPNLVRLDELLAEGERWCFVMEYVDGVDFLTHVRGAPKDGDAVALASARDAATIVDVDAPSVATSTVLASGLDAEGLARLRAAATQLVRGVGALHAHGKLHRDLKPSNVLVTGEGRVVVLDFGLVTPEDPDGSDRYAPTAGTPGYMAPEQAQGGAATTASDWYALGAMIYEALVGRLPFTGPGERVLVAKVSEDALPPSVLVEGVPPELDALCVSLLARAPSARPDLAAILAALAPSAEEVRPRLRAPARATLVAMPGGAATAAVRLQEDAGSETPSGGLISGERAVGSSPASGEAPRERAGPRPRTLLLGRERELAVLEQALGDVAGGAVAVLVDGPSGVGKTTLVRTFVDNARRRAGALVLEGRCYERESVPYKAFDALVDALERHLGALTEEERAAMLPPGLHALARIFPVLREVAAADASRGSGDGPDPSELQARAFSCLKLLFARLASRAPVVLVIDDLQWGDRDSGKLLAELLAPPASPSLLLICTYRTEEASHSPLLADIARGEFLTEARRLRLDPLEGAVALQLAELLLEAHGPRAGAVVDAGRIAREAEGNPFFIEQLARFVEEEGDDTSTRTLSLAQLVVARKERLPPESQRLLEVVSVAGRPLEQGVAAAAAGLPDAASALAQLRSAMLVRTHGPRLEDDVEPYHDRIRQSLVAELTAPARAGIHLALARAEVATGRSDPRALAHHFHAGGNLEAAHEHAVRGAEEAERSLAFERAAELYGLALECRPHDRMVSLTARRADALVHAGRCADAAPLFLAASARSSGVTAWELRRRAAEQYLVSGRIDQGSSVLGPVLRDVGLRSPGSPAFALTLALVSVLQIELRGRRARGGVGPEARALAERRLSACWAAGKGLLSVDPARGAYFLIRSLQLALDVGDAPLVARSLAIYGMMQVFEGAERAHRRGTRVLDEAAALAAPLADPYLDGTLAVCRGTASMSVGLFREGVDLMEQGLQTLEQRCTGVTWEVATGRSSCFNARLWLGEVRTIAETAPVWRRAGDRVGNLFASVTGNLYSAFGELVAGDPVAARTRARRAISRWTRGGYHFQHWLAHKVEVWCDLYEGDVERAWARCQEVEGPLDASGLLRVQLMKIDALLLHGNVAIAASRTRPGLRREVERRAQALDGMGRPMAVAAARFLEGQLALAEGRPERARLLLEQALTGAEACELSLQAECVRRRIGEARGGELGGALIARVDRWMEGQGVRDPARFVEAFAPLPPVPARR